MRSQEFQHRCSVWPLHLSLNSKFLFCPFGQLDCLKRWWVGSGEDQARNGRGTGEERARTGRGTGEAGRGTGECKGARGERGKRSCLEGVSAQAGQSEIYYFLILLVPFIEVQLMRWTDFSRYRPKHHDPMHSNDCIIAAQRPCTDSRSCA